MRVKFREEPTQQSLTLEIYIQSKDRFFWLSTTLPKEGFIVKRNVAFRCASGGKLQANFEIFERKGGFLVFLIDKNLISLTGYLKKGRPKNPFYHVTSFLVHFDSSRLILHETGKGPKVSCTWELTGKGRDLTSDRLHFNFCPVTYCLLFSSMKWG